MGQDIMIQAMPERYRERIQKWNTPPPEELGTFEGFWWAQFGKWCGADASTMRVVFERVERRWGSFDNYLDEIGFEAEQRAKLAEALTCEA